MKPGMPDGGMLVTQPQSIPEAEAKRDDANSDAMRIIIDVAEGRAPNLLAQSAIAQFVQGRYKPLVALILTVRG